MGFAEGVVWSLLGAVAHTVIDVLRKFGAQRLPPADLIALLTIYNAAFAVLGVWLIDGGLPVVADMPNPALFTKATVLTACTGLTAAVLYQRALSIAPLSLTVPYLAFAPVFVVFVSPMFLVGEVPSAMGLVGVAVVSIAGYKLGVLGAADAAAHVQQAGSKAAKPKHPLLPVGAQAGYGNGSTVPGRLSLSGTLEPEGQALIPAAHVHGHCEDEATVYGQQPQQQQGRGPYQRQPAQLVPYGASSPELHTHNSTRREEGGPLQHQQAGLSGPEQQHSQQQHLQPPPGAGRGSSGGGSKQQSAWAIAYYKQKSPQLGVWEAACGGLQSAAQQLLGTGMSPRSRTAGSAAHNIFGAVGAGGHPHQHHHSNGLHGSPLGSSQLSGTDTSLGSSGGSAHVWVDSQAKAGKDPQLGDSKLGLYGSLAPPKRKRRGPLLQLQLGVQSLARLLSGPTAGPALVLIVAFLYSLTASFDKLGMSASSSTAFYIMVQRLLIAGASLVYLLVGSPRTLRHLYHDAALLLSMSLVEQAAIVLYFKAIQNILVSYMVAIKRINVLMSVLVGCVMFNERVGRRMPYILLMLVGMLLIVLQPGHEVLHHSHHTRH